MNLEFGIGIRMLRSYHKGHKGHEGEAVLAGIIHDRASPCTETARSEMHTTSTKVREMCDIVSARGPLPRRREGTKKTFLSRGDPGGGNDARLRRDACAAGPQTVARDRARVAVCAFATRCTAACDRLTGASRRASKPNIACARSSSWLRAFVSRSGCALRAVQTTGYSRMIQVGLSLGVLGVLCVLGGGSAGIVTCQS
jgi:hypothetical protein